MKKKILLAALFSVTAVLAAIGLATEKTMAQGGLDDPFWMETGETLGVPCTHDVDCQEMLMYSKHSKDVDLHWVYAMNTQHSERVTMTIIRTATVCATVSLNSCSPVNPC